MKGAGGSHTLKLGQTKTFSFLFSILLCSNPSTRDLESCRTRYPDQKRKEKGLGLGTPLSFSPLRIPTSRRPAPVQSNIQFFFSCLARISLARVWVRSALAAKKAVGFLCARLNPCDPRPTRRPLHCIALLQCKFMSNWRAIAQHHLAATPPRPTAISRTTRIELAWLVLLLSLALPFPASLSQSLFRLQNPGVRRGTYL